MQVLTGNISPLGLRRLSAVALVVCLATTGLVDPPKAWGEQVAGANAAARAEVYDEASRLVRSNFYDRNMKGKDWDSVTAKHRAQYLAAGTRRGRSAAINAMLGELSSSHTLHVTKEDPAYYQLVDIFSFALRRDIPRHFPGGLISYPGIGIFTREIDGKTIVSGIMAGLPAAMAGLLVGDEIIAADGGAFRPVQSFRGKTGRNVSLSVRRAPEGPVLDIPVTPEMIEPGKALQTAMRESARIIEASGKRLGYIHVWSYAGQEYQDILVNELSTGKLKDADALIWDLRDGWGGAHPRYIDVFNARAADMTLTARNGEVEIANFRWRKPVALLVNGGTRSGKEVLAHSFKKYGYGPVIGTRTSGALLAGRGFLLADGSFLMVAVNDVTVDGERLEGTGVEPTVEVPFDLPYARGDDPQLNKAVELLSAPTGEPG